MAIQSASYSAAPKVAALPSPSAALEGVTVFLTTNKHLYHCDGTSWIDLSATTGGASLTPTAVKTGNYTAAVGELVRVNSTAGGFTVTLPSSLADGDQVGVLDVGYACGAHAVLVAPSASKTVEGDATGLSIDVEGASVVFLYSSSLSDWKAQDSYFGAAVDMGIIHPFLLMS